MQHSLEKIFKLSAGLRHCICAAESSHSLADIFAWGYNNWGELGLGDTDIRLYPTKITALRQCKILSLACGERHSVMVTSHKPMLAKNVPSLKPMFHMLSEEDAKYRKHLLKKLKVRIQRDGMLPPSVLDNPNAPLPNQPGSSAEPIPNDRFEKGLRYCMDTFKDLLDWRRQSMEACFTVHISPKLTLKSVCLSCARRCLRHHRLVPYIRPRTLVAEGSSLQCDCNLTGNCRCRWSPIREVFDSFAVHEADECIGLHQLRSLVKRLRFPFPVEAADLDDANMTFTAQAYASMQQQSSKLRKPVNRSMFKRVVKKKETDEHSWASGSALQQSTLPSSLEVNEGDRRQSKEDAPDLSVRIDAVAFERWYRVYFDEPDVGSAQVAVSQKIAGKITEEEAQEEEYNIHT
ncbi:hypothetical protein EON64_15540 [archaeon]|nr:MAG: hypothetical protein EON64_15540 [archaeon]